MKLEELHNLFDREKTREIAFNGKCKDCSKEITVLIVVEETGFKISGGTVYKIHDSEDYKGVEKFIVKCNECYKKERLLTNFQECEVYSRIVGYLRPTNQWNPGKLAEFKDRRMFDNSL